MRRLSKRSLPSSFLLSSASSSSSSFFSRSYTQKLPILSAAKTTTFSQKQQEIAQQSKNSFTTQAQAQQCPFTSGGKKEELKATTTTTPKEEVVEEKAKPFEEMPLVSLQEIMEMGGFLRLLVLYPALFKKYGYISRAVLQGSNAVWVFHPDDIRKVMNNEGKWPIGAASTVWPLVRVMAKSNVKMLGFSQGEEWKRQRTALQKNFFPPLDAETYMPLVTPVVKDALKMVIQHQDKLNKFLPNVTLEMIAAVLFGESLGTFTGTISPEDEEYIRKVHALGIMAEDLMFRNPAEVTDEEMQPLQDAFDYSYKRGSYHVNKTIKKFEAGELKTPATPFIVKTMDLKDMTREEVAQNVVGLLGAGVDTTANSLQWFLYHLARNPQVQEKLAEEVKGLLKGRSLTKEDMTYLPYFKNCMKEVFRLTPTTTGTARILPVPITLQGYEIPPYTLFFLAPYPICMNGEVFENPEEFQPERYDKKSKDERKESNPFHDSPYVHMPFSRGPRMCMGSRLAELEIASFIAGFVQEYEIALAPNSPVPEAIARLTVRPEPSPTYTITHRPQ